MQAIFLGTSCMVPTKDRNHQAIFIPHHREGILVDCGEGTQRQLKIADIKPTKITRILITHWHGDHVLGLPGLLQTMGANEYEKTLHIYGPKGTKNSFDAMFKAFLFQPNFAYEIHELQEDTIETQDLIIQAKPLKHALPNLGFSIKEKDTRKIRLPYIKKEGIPEGPLLGQLQDGESIEWEGRTISPEDATFIVEGKKIAIIMDTLPTKNAYDLAENADLLISEATYLSDLEHKAEEYMHMTAAQAAQLASQSNAKKLVITHFSQRYKTTEDILQEAKTIFPDTIAAYDFLKVSV